MKRILLLGDSIRQNYQSYVKENLAGIAEVFYPNENGRFGYYTLRYLHEWIGDLLGGGVVQIMIYLMWCISMWGYGMYYG